jgi:UDP-N-acetyl-D-mannosaminuronate dehydrogenase
MIHQPGLGVGGHCIPVYPYFMINDAAPDEVALARSARVINDRMPKFALDSIRDHLDEITDRRALVIGLSYRANVKESAFSMTYRLVEELERRGFTVSVCDPLFTDDEIRDRGLTPQRIEDLESYPVVVVQAFHSLFHDLPIEFLQRASIIVDGRADLSPLIEPSSEQVHFRIGSALSPDSSHGEAHATMAMTWNNGHDGLVR